MTDTIVVALISAVGTVATGFLSVIHSDIKQMKRDIGSIKQVLLIKAPMRVVADLDKRLSIVEESNDLHKHRS